LTFEQESVEAERMADVKIEAGARFRMKLEARKKLPFLIEFGTEEDIVAYTRQWNPQITNAELKEVVRLFLYAKHEKHGRGHPPQSC
jgi:hypothetical protein